MEQNLEKQKEIECGNPKSKKGVKSKAHPFDFDLITFDMIALLHVNLA